MSKYKDVYENLRSCPGFDSSLKRRVSVEDELEFTGSMKNASTEEERRRLIEDFVEMNMNLSLTMAHRFYLTNGELDLDHLISISNLILLKCVKKYNDPSKSRFSTYFCDSVFRSFCRYKKAHNSRRFFTLDDEAIDFDFPQKDLGERDLRKSLDEAISQLPAIRAEIINLRYLRGLNAPRDAKSSDPKNKSRQNKPSMPKQKSIAVGLGISPDMVKHHEREALKSLRENERLARTMSTI